MTATATMTNRRTAPPHTSAPRQRRAAAGMMTILDAMNDAALFKPWFKDPATWEAWCAFLAATFGLPMTPEQFAIYTECTGRTDRPAAANEVWAQVGRRGGKSLTMALCAVFLATFRDYRPYLVPGERGLVAVMASDKKQARTILRYASAMLTRVPMLAKLVERAHAEGFDLKNEVSIEITTASLRAARGYTIVAALLDEIAFFRSEDSANPDYEILNSIRPAMGTIPNALLLCGSSRTANQVSCTAPGKSISASKTMTACFIGRHPRGE